MSELIGYLGFTVMFLWIVSIIQFLFGRVNFAENTATLSIGPVILIFALWIYAFISRKTKYIS